MRKLAIPIRVAESPESGEHPCEDHNPCERCLCASCERLCMKCTISCSPMDKRHIPLIGCPDYVNMRTITPLRYTVRGGHDLEYKLHLSNIKG